MGSNNSLIVADESGIKTELLKSKDSLELRESLEEGKTIKELSNRDNRIYIELIFYMIENNSQIIEWVHDRYFNKSIVEINTDMIDSWMLDDIVNKNMLIVFCDNVLNHSLTGSTFRSNFFKRKGHVFHCRNLASQHTDSFIFNYLKSYTDLYDNYCLVDDINNRTDILKIIEVLLYDKAFNKLLFVSNNKYTIEQLKKDGDTEMYIVKFLVKLNQH
jgi:hypothetical protein